MPRKGKGQKVAAAAGQTYGNRKAQEDAQKVVPLPVAAQPVMQPGQMGSPTRRTEQPRQPVTAGAPVGAGAGSEALTVPVHNPGEELSQRLASYLPILETKAAQPEASANFRMFVRRVRALAAQTPGV